jgi:predicted O-linked N-acetylglucosamine transferase (SPINDLY family)
MSDEGVAELIHKEEIDILFDLDGHSGKRLPVFARKAAPIQVTWLGYPGTTGVSAIDFVLADRFHIPEGDEPFHTENALRMPNGYACYGAPNYAPEVISLPAQFVGYVTFGSFNNPVKYAPRILDLWAEILQRVPTSQILLKYGGLDSHEVQEHVRGLFMQRGVDGNRIIIEGWSEHRELLAAYNRVDLALDTQPYSGGVTTCEALWMGVPVVTYAGKTFAGRHATSHLHNATPIWRSLWHMMARATLILRCSGPIGWMNWPTFGPGCEK